MDVKEFYLVTSGDYEGTMSRLMTEERIMKYLRKFKDSTEYADMVKAIEAKDWELGFRGSHSLKGMCANLGLSKLQNSASELCETMRHGAPEVDITPLLEQVRTDYDEVIANID